MGFVGRIIKEFARGTTVTGFASEEFGEVRNAQKRKLKGVGGYYETGTYNKRGKQVPPKGKKKR